MAIDALPYKKNTAYQQYEKKNIDRELKKAFVGFNQMEYHTVRTGNWGGGAFNGDKIQKFIIQVIACAEAGKKMVYCCFAPEDIKIFPRVYKFCVDKTVKNLYDTLMEGKSEEQLRDLIGVRRLFVGSDGKGFKFF